MPDRPGQTRESLPDHLGDALDVVFVGVPAYDELSEGGHHYADPHDRFWDLVNEAELVSDIVGAENDHLVLDEKCGLTVLTRRKPAASDVGPNAGGFDVDGFIEKVERYKPKIVAFNGKIAYRTVFKQDPGDYGLTDDIIGDSYVFALPSSSERDASLAFQKKLHWYKKLKATLRTL